MILSFTPGLLKAFPNFDEMFSDVKRIAVALDPDIRVSELRVEVRLHQSPEYYSGWAYPFLRTRTKYRTYHHRDGCITMRIGSACTHEQIIRLSAHELRHIGQFHRGRAVHGYLTYDPLTEAQSEADAEAFEERVLERYSK